MGTDNQSVTPLPAITVQVGVEPSENLPQFFPGNSFVVARRASGGSAGGSCAHARGYKARRFFPSGAKILLRSGRHESGSVIKDAGLDPAAKASMSGVRTTG